MTLYKNKYRVESTRLPNRDYAANGWYFVTICTGDRQWFFGDVIAGKMRLSSIGEVALQFWAEIPSHFKHTYVDAYVIMPNHVHGIVVIDRSDCRDVACTYCRDVACNVSTRVETVADSVDDDIYRTMSEISPKAGSLSVILRSYKGAVSRWCRMNGYSSFGWQPRFHEHIIRTDGSLNWIQEYIINNPAKWEDDKNNLPSLWM